MFKKLDWKSVVFFALIALLVFLGAGQIYYGHQEQIFAEKLEEHSGINSWEEKEETLYIRTEENIDLFVLWEELRLQGSGMVLQVERGSSPGLLQDALQQMEFPLYEGMQRGNWMEVRREIKEIARDRNLGMEMKMDRENIYLTLSREDSFLARTFPWEEVKTYD